MFSERFGFSWLGLIVFILPMLINIVFFITEKNADTPQNPCPYKWIEIIEQSARVLLAAALCVLVSNQRTQWSSPFFILSILFLILYYIVWIRYFAGGMDAGLLSEKFLFVPIPLAVFPVLYFLFAALWLHNGIAAIIVCIFGAAHYAVSYFNLCK